MNCDLGPLIDGYLENALSRTDLQRLEGHLGTCSHCAEEMRDRLAFERRVKQSLEASVQHLRLPPEASRRILCAVDGQVRQPSLSHQFIRLIPMLSGVAIVVLLLVGLFLLLSQISTPPGMEQTALLPSNQLPALVSGGLLVEPREIHPGDSFTVTFPLEKEQFPTRKSILCTLEISGPSGRYLFVLAMKRPSMTSGRSVLQVTPDTLAAYCQEQYRISPAEILSVPGVYRFRVTLAGRSAAPSQ